MLRFDRDAYNAKLEQGADLGDEGVEEAFDLVAEISDRYAAWCNSWASSHPVSASRQQSG